MRLRFFAFGGAMFQARFWFKRQIGQIERRAGLQSLPQSYRTNVNQRRVDVSLTAEELLCAELSAAQRRIEDLLRESGQQYAKGMIDALPQWGDLPKKPE